MGRGVTSAPHQLRYLNWKRTDAVVLALSAKVNVSWRHVPPHDLCVFHWKL